MTTRDDAVRAAAVHVVDSLARQAARAPRDAAVAALGVDASEEQIEAWIREWRPEAVVADSA